MGREYVATNAIVQGCPLSVVLLNALLSIWSKAVMQEVPGVNVSVYVDDSGCCGLREASINRAHERYLKRVAELGLKAHEEKSHAAQKEDIKLGFSVNGIGVVVGNREDRWALLSRALRRASVQRRMHGNALEILLGHAASRDRRRRLGPAGLRPPQLAGPGPAGDQPQQQHHHCNS